jgi:tetrahydromethanopterin S-methyltransferase subunit G
MSQSRKEKLNEIVNDLRDIEERLEKIEQDIENPNNLLLIGAPIRLLINVLDDLNKFRETM